MTRLDDAFQRLHATLSLRPGLTQQVDERRERLVGILRSRWRTPEVIPTGSYARGTVAPPLDDIDLMFVLGDASSAEGSPLAMLTEVHQTLRWQYPNARLQGRSIGLPFGDFSIDVVPAFKTSSGYLIADIDPNNLIAPARWIPTDPRLHAQRLRDANGRTNGTAGTLVAMLKLANREASPKLKSFHIEAMTLDALDAGLTTARGSSQALCDALDALGLRVEQRCTDRATGAAIDDYLDGGVRRQIAQRYRNQAGTLREAIQRDDVSLAKRVVSRLP